MTHIIALTFITIAFFISTLTYGSTCQTFDKKTAKDIKHYIESLKDFSDDSVDKPWMKWLVEVDFSKKDYAYTLTQSKTAKAKIQKMAKGEYAVLLNDRQLDLEKTYIEVTDGQPLQTLASLVGQDVCATAVKVPNDLSLMQLEMHHLAYRRIFVEQTQIQQFLRGCYFQAMQHLRPEMHNAFNNAGFKVDGGIQHFENDKVQGLFTKNDDGSEMISFKQGMSMQTAVLNGSKSVDVEAGYHFMVRMLKKKKSILISAEKPGQYNEFGEELVAPKPAVYQEYDEYQVVMTLPERSDASSLKGPAIVNSQTGRELFNMFDYFNFKTPKNAQNSLALMKAELDQKYACSKSFLFRSK